MQAVLHLIKAFYRAHSDSEPDEFTARQTVVLDIVRNDMLASVHGRRWSQESKQLFAAMHIASPSATRTFVVNMPGASLRTTTREIQIHKQPLAFGLRRDVLLAAGDTLHNVMALHSIPDGRLPLCVAADESGVTAVVRVVPLSKASVQPSVFGPQMPLAVPKVVVVGTCGFKQHGVKHACCMDTQALEVPEHVLNAVDGFEALKSWLQGFTLASRTCFTVDSRVICTAVAQSCARAFLCQRACADISIMVLSPLHPWVPAVVVYVFATCNRFDAVFVKQQLHDLMELWESLGQSKRIGIILNDASDGDVRRVLNQRRIFNRESSPYLFYGISHPSFTASVLLNGDRSSLSESIPIQDDLQCVCVHSLLLFVGM